MNSTRVEYYKSFLEIITFTILLIYNGAIYVVTQLEIIKINITDLAIIETYSLPDYFESVEFNKGIIEIKCVGNKVVKYKTIIYEKTLFSSFLPEIYRVDPIRYFVLQTSNKSLDRNSQYYYRFARR